MIFLVARWSSARIQAPPPLLSPVRLAVAIVSDLLALSLQMYSSAIIRFRIIRYGSGKAASEQRPITHFVLHDFLRTRFVLPEMAVHFQTGNTQMTP
jgi:hypothetical protein